MNVRLDIERLVLDGIELPPGSDHRLQAAVESELTRLLAQRGLGSGIRGMGSVHRLAAPPLQGTRNPASLGTRIASSIYGSLER